MKHTLLALALFGFAAVNANTAFSAPMPAPAQLGWGNGFKATTTPPCCTTKPGTVHLDDMDAACASVDFDRMLAEEEKLEGKIRRQLHSLELQRDRLAQENLRLNLVNVELMRMSTREQKVWCDSLWNWKYLMHQQPPSQ